MIGEIIFFAGNYFPLICVGCSPMIFSWELNKFLVFLQIISSSLIYKMMTKKYFFPLMRLLDNFCMKLQYIFINLHVCHMKKFSSNSWMVVFRPIWTQIIFSLYKFATSQKNLEWKHKIEKDTLKAWRQKGWKYIS